MAAIPSILSWDITALLKYYHRRAGLGRRGVCSENDWISRESDRRCRADSFVVIDQAACRHWSRFIPSDSIPERRGGAQALTF